MQHIVLLRDFLEMNTWRQFIIGYDEISNNLSTQKLTPHFHTQDNVFLHILDFEISASHKMTSNQE